MNVETHASDVASYGYGPALEGPYLDLRTGRGNHLAYARIQGDIDYGTQKYYWFKGSIMANRPGEKIQDILGAQGFGVIRLNEREDGAIERMARQIGIITDLRDLPQDSVDLLNGGFVAGSLTHPTSFFARFV